MVKLPAVSTVIVLSLVFSFGRLAFSANNEPSAVELAMWEYAVSTGKMEEVDRFLDLYPDSMFTDEAIKLKAALAASANTENTTPAESGNAESSATTQPSDAVPELVKFDTPLSTDPSDKRRSIQDLANGSPVFPPIEELPAEVWEGKNCSNCHAWKKENLCEQAQFLAKKDQDAMARIQHPYGGFFKDALKQWATDGCL